MIRLIIGNVGSAKTSSAVRYMKNHPEKRFITNIQVRGKGFSHVKHLSPDMIIHKEPVINTNGSQAISRGKPVYEYSLNTEFWKKELKSGKGSLNVILDEAHNILNSRRSLSKINEVMTDFLALLRRVLGSVDADTGELVLISQLSRRLDIIAKEMANMVEYTIHHYKKYCKDCDLHWSENNEIPEPFYNCPCCGSTRIERYAPVVETFSFKGTEQFERWYYGGMKTYFRRYFIKDIYKVWGNFDTLQFDDMISQYR